MSVIPRSTAAFVALALALTTGAAPAFYSFWRTYRLSAADLHSGGWIAFQAQLEFVKLQNATLVASAYPSEKATEAVRNRAAIFLSRLKVLSESDEAAFIRSKVDIISATSALASDVLELRKQLDSLGDVTPDPAALRAWIETYSQKAPLLQTIAVETVRYSADRSAEHSDIILPIAAFIALGLTLCAALFAIRRENRLRSASDAASQMALRVSQQHTRILEQLYRTLPVGILVHDGSAAVGINSAAAAILGVRSDAPLAEAWRQFQQVRWSPELSGTARGGKLLKADGTYLSLQSSEIEAEWGDGTASHLVVISDVSYSHVGMAAAQRASQLAALGEMAASIAHELNQPLATIALAAGNASLALEGFGPGPAVIARKKLERIQEQVARAKRITDHMRKRGRGQPIHKVAFPARRSIEAALEFIGDQLRLSSIRVQLELQITEAVVLRGSQVLFEQALLNLISNSRDAFAPDAIDPTISVSARDDGNFLFLTIHDNAGGIPPPLRERIFTAFFTTKTPDRGTGLGLTFCKSIVEDMNGCIALEHPEGGTLVLIQIPVTSPTGATNP